ncbi:unnamed protein product [Cuscuta epithymum]|uniref:Glycosyltransferase n=2 Tax=Cuscuta epithymum TaxID=186058 RepID=A0AAV0FCY3_9ASTE|nr:unnamed protein product [Cuscuta epithymum]
MDNRHKTVAHILLFPLPIQSPVNSMLKLAELLCLHGLRVTFLTTHYNHRRLLRCTDVDSRLRRYAAAFRFEVIPDGLPEDHPRSVEHLGDLLGSVRTAAEPVIRRMMRSAVTCAIVEGMFGYAFESGTEFGVPVFAFETISPCCLWVYLCIPKLIQAGQLPIQGEDLDRLVAGVPGMEGLLRVRDLPHFFRAKSDPWAEKNSELVKAEIHFVPKSHGLILNSFEELDGPIVSNIRSYCPKTYTIGPVQQHLKTRLAGQREALGPPSTSFWQEDRTCMEWLDRQPDESVLYVSFGSLATLTMAQFLEFWHALVDSDVRFLWVVRPNSLKSTSAEDDQLSKGSADSSQLLKETIVNNSCIENNNKWYIVSWAPQEEVLLHPAVGGFLTHSGWNSTLESIIAGKPMICWALGVDQMVTSRLVSQVWKIGLDIKDRCDRVTIQNAVLELMGSRRQEFKKSILQLSRLAKESVNAGGSSHTSLDHLINDIRKMTCIKLTKNNES